MTSFRRSRLRRFPATLCAAGLVLASLVTSCNTAKAIRHTADGGPYLTPRNFAGVPRLPASLRRVVLLPVAGSPSVPAETLASFDPLVAAELQRTGRFEVVTVSPAALMRLCDHSRILSSDALPAGLLSLLAREFDADGVLFVDITTLSPYPPLALGFRSKLAAVDGTMLWAFDTLFSAHDPATANSAERYDKLRRATSGHGENNFSILRSPARFADFAAATAFGTLPSR